MYYENLFKICGYTDEEIENQRSRLETFLERLNVNNEAAIAHAEKTVTQSYDVDMVSVQKFLWVLMNSCVDAVLARDVHEHVINCNWPFFILNLLSQFRY